MSDLATWLETQMERRSLSLLRTALLTRVGAGTLSSILHEGHIPKLVTLFRLADFFDTPRLDVVRMAAGEELAPLVAGDGGAMMVASSDMSHYIPAERARELDLLAVERMLQLDPEGLYRVVPDRRISMCGVAPAVIMLQAARRAGASGDELVCYTNSGEVSGDREEVVGYASLVVF